MPVSVCMVYRIDGTSQIHTNSLPFPTVGAAYVFTYVGGAWSQTAKVRATDASNDDNFGMSVSLHHDTLTVGAYLDDDRGSQSGNERGWGEGAV